MGLVTVGEDSKKPLPTKTGSSVLEQYQAFKDLMETNKSNEITSSEKNKIVKEGKQVVATIQSLYTILGQAIPVFEYVQTGSSFTTNGKWNQWPFASETWTTDEKRYSTQTLLQDVLKDQQTEGTIIAAENYAVQAPQRISATIAQFSKTDADLVSIGGACGKPPSVKPDHEIAYLEKGNGSGGKESFEEIVNASFYLCNKLKKEGADKFILGPGGSNIDLAYRKEGEWYEIHIPKKQYSLWSTAEATKASDALTDSFNRLFK